MEIKYVLLEMNVHLCLIQLVTFLFLSIDFCKLFFLFDFFVCLFCVILEGQPSSNANIKNVFIFTYTLFSFLYKMERWIFLLFFINLFF